MASPDISVCIVNWNTRLDLEQSLGSILSNQNLADRLRVQLIVVDNASTDGSAEMVRERFPGVRLIESETNLGFSRGYNRAAQFAEGRHLLMLNPDTVVQTGALKILVDFLDLHSPAGAAGPRLLNSDGSLQFSCRRFPRPLAAILRNTILGSIFRGNRFTRDYLMQDWDHLVTRKVDWVSGASICIRRETWKQVGGFDENFFMYAEDMDWCWRAWAAGWQIFYVPEAVVIHHIGRSSDQRPLSMAAEFHRSMARFYRKHYAPRWPRGLRWLPLVGIRLRAGLMLTQILWSLTRNKLSGMFRRSS